MIPSFGIPRREYLSVEMNSNESKGCLNALFRTYYVPLWGEFLLVSGLHGVGHGILRQECLLLNSL